MTLELKPFIMNAQASEKITLELTEEEIVYLCVLIRAHRRALKSINYPSIDDCESVWLMKKLNTLRPDISLTDISNEVST